MLFKFKTGLKRLYWQSSKRKFEVSGQFRLESWEQYKTGFRQPDPRVPAHLRTADRATYRSAVKRRGNKKNHFFLSFSFLCILSDMQKPPSRFTSDRKWEIIKSPIRLCSGTRRMYANEVQSCVVSRHAKHTRQHRLIEMPWSHRGNNNINLRIQQKSVGIETRGRLP